MNAAWWPTALRLATRHRTWISAGLAAAAMACAISVLAPRPAAGVPVLTAARDLAAGTVLSAADLAVVPLSSGAVPAGAFGASVPALGRLLAGPVRRGEPLTDARLAGPSLLAGTTGALVAVPVRVADASATVVSAGDHVDVVGVGSAGTVAQVVAPDALVLAVPGQPDAGGAALGSTGSSGSDTAAATTGALIVVATSPATGLRLATAAATGHLTLLLRPRA